MAELEKVAERHGYKLKPLGWCSEGSAECIQMLGEGAMYVTDGQREGNDLPFFAIVQDQ